MAFTREILKRGTFLKEHVKFLEQKNEMPIFFKLSNGIKRKSR
jgi:hypothetical protein